LEEGENPKIDWIEMQEKMKREEIKPETFIEVERRKM